MPAARLSAGPAPAPRECPDHPQGWARTEFGALQFWDTRLERSAFALADDFFGHAQARGLGRRCAERGRTVAYRFCQNPKISMQTLLEAHREAVIGRMRAHPGPPGMGPIGTNLEAGPIGLVLQFAAMRKAAHQPSIAVH